MNLLEIRGVIKSIRDGISKGYSYCDHETLDRYKAIERELLAEVNSDLAAKGLPQIKPLPEDPDAVSGGGKSPRGDQAILR